MLKSVVGFFIGENSHKRELGLALIAALTTAYYFGLLTADQYEATVAFAAIFTGMAYNARITKLKKAFLKAGK